MKYIKEYDYSLLDNIISLQDKKSSINWNNFFGNKNPLIVEVGCGNGHFLIEQAKNNKENNYIGIDIKEKRIIRCKEKQIKYNITNIAWICDEALNSLSRLFENKSISLIFMPFPDPWPKKRHHKHRLFQKEFINILHEKLVLSGLFLFITDYYQYFEKSYQLVMKDKRFDVVENNEKNKFEFTNSLFGEKWKKENKEFYSFCIKKAAI